MNHIPMRVRIIQAFIKYNEPKLTASEIAKYCNASLQSISYHLKQMSETSLIIKETNLPLNKNYYYINDFFLNHENLEQAREAIHPFIEFFIDSFYFPDEMSEKAIERDIIEFIQIIAWLFAEETKNDFDNAKKNFE